MVAPADSSAITAGHDGTVVKTTTTTKPLPRAIQLVMTISSTTTASTMKTTIKEHGVDRFFAWMNLVFLPSVFITVAALLTYHILRDCGDDEVISGGGGFVLLAVLDLPAVYLAAVLAARGHLELFAPQTPYAAWEALDKVGFRGMGPPVLLTSLVATMLYTLMPAQAWLLLVAPAYLLGLLVASTIAFWLCLLRTYGGERRRQNIISSGSEEAVIDGLAYLYSRLLYEYAVRFPEDAGMHAAA